MPTYKVKPTELGAMAMEPPAKGMKHYPTIHFPVSVEMLKILDVGEDTTVTLKGKVVGLENREHMAECRIEVHEVSVEAEGEFEKMSKDEDE